MLDQTKHILREHTCLYASFDETATADVSRGDCVPRMNADVEHRVTWDIGKLTIGLGQRYVGAIDELLILDVALSAKEVAELFGLTKPLGSLY